LGLIRRLIARPVAAVQRSPLEQDALDLRRRAEHLRTAALAARGPDATAVLLRHAAAAEHAARRIEQCLEAGVSKESAAASRHLMKMKV
jgi:hypothetical protein